MQSKSDRTFCYVNNAMPSKQSCSKNTGRQDQGWVNCYVASLFLPIPTDICYPTEVIYSKHATTLSERARHVAPHVLCLRPPPSFYNYIHTGHFPKQLMASWRQRAPAKYTTVTKAHWTCAAKIFSESGGFLHYHVNERSKTISNALAHQFAITP